MILQSHNSWSYRKSKKWWLTPLRFTAKCQSKSIAEQYYKYGVRSFDLRVRFNKDNEFVVAHGMMVYDCTKDDILKDLAFINNVGGCSVRILHEVRNSKQYTKSSLLKFREFCEEIKEKFENIVFYCGRNLFNWEEDYYFDYHPTELAKYSSVCPPKILDDWFPWIYARFHNKKTFMEGTDAEILAVDFVNIGNSYVSKQV